MLWVEQYAERRPSLVAAAARLALPMHAEDIVQDAAIIAMQRHDDGRRFSWRWAMLTARRLYIETRERRMEAEPGERRTDGVASSMLVCRALERLGAAMAERVADGERNRELRTTRRALNG